MRPSFVYGAVRASRGAAVAASVGLLTDDPNLSLAAVAVSEVGSVAVDMLRILPLLGNLFWLIMLFPVVVQTYKDVYVYSFNDRYARELDRLLPFVVGMMSTMLFSSF